MRHGFVRTALVLGVLSCVGPVSIDMYLPAMPQIAGGLSAGSTAVQATLSAYFLAFGLAQLVYGPLADQYGRKLPLLAGLAIFVAGTAGCALAPSAEMLIAFRFLQGLGGAAVMVIPRAVVRDLYTGPQAARLMALIMLVISVSPLLAPLGGTAVMALAGWRAIFWFMLAVALLSIAMTLFLQPETLAREARVPVNVANLLRGSADLLRDPYFMGLTFVGGFGMASFFVFIATASFVYTGHYGLSPTGFSLAFAVNAAGFFAASQMAGPLGERYGMRRVVRLATAGFAAAAVTLLLVSLSVAIPLYVLIGGLIVANGFLGLVIPSTMVMALDDHGDRAGLASSLGGTLQMLAGSLMIALSGPFLDGTPTPMVAAIALCSVIALVLAIMSLGKGTQVAAAE